MVARSVKIAVVGSGLAGLTAAYLLTNTPTTGDVEFEVHLFEKSSSLGMDSSSISLPVTQGNEWRIDVPMRSFQGGYYPQLITLYKRLGAAFVQRDFSYSFSLLSPSTKACSRKITTTMIYNGASGRAGVSMPSVLNDCFPRSQDKELANSLAAKALKLALFALLTLQVILNYVRLILLSLPFLRPGNIRTMTFSQWAEYSVPTGILARWVGWDTAWRDFTWRILVPLFSAVCTASEEDVMAHPAEEMLDYIWLTLGTHHYVVVNGSRDIVSRLTSNLQHIHLSSLISAIYHDANDPRLASIECKTSKGTTVHSGFNHIIFATQADRAVPLLRSYLSSLPLSSPQRQPVEGQIRCLQTFQYRKTIVVNHTDDTLMPDSLRDRRELNLVSLSKEVKSSPHDRKAVEDKFSPHCVSLTHTMATHILPYPAKYPAHLPQVYQTTNPIVAPCEESIVSVAALERAVLTLEAKESLEGLHRETSRPWWQCRVQTSGKLGPLQGGGRWNQNNCIKGSSDVPGIWICGSFAYTGIPLLEGCVVSARKVVEQGVFGSEGVVIINTS